MKYWFKNVADNIYIYPKSAPRNLILQTRTSDCNSADVISIVLIECKIILLFMLSSCKLTSGIAIFPMFTVQTICVKLFSELQ